MRDPYELERQALTRMVDGRARDDDRSTLAACAMRSPNALDEFTRQRRVVTALRSGGPRLPAGLRLRLAETGMGEPAVRRGPARSAWGVTAVAAGCLLAATVSFFALAAGGVGRSGLPPVAQIAMLALRSPTSPPPTVSHTDPGSLETRFAGVQFPAYERQFNTAAVGWRIDSPEGRTVETVYYRTRRRQTISYSVVSGSSLPVRRPTAQAIVDRVPIRVYRARGLSYVVLVRDRRTCILAGRVPSSLLVALAAAPLRSEQT
jgi:hypothetical protein